MTGPADHDQWAQLAVGHVLDALEPAEEAAFAAHLPTCPTCRRLLAEMRGVAAELAYAAEPVPLPDGLWARIQGAVADSGRPPLPPQTVAAGEERSGIGSRPPGAVPPADRPVVTTGPGRPAPPPPAASGPPLPRAFRRLPPRVQVAGLVTAAVLVAVASLVTAVLAGRYFQVRHAQVDAERSLSAVLDCGARSDCQLVGMRPPRGGGAAAVALVDADRRVGLVANDLPVTDRRGSYVLWQVPADGRARGVARFAVPDEPGTVVRLSTTLPLPIAGGQALAITREPGEALPPAPTTTPLLAGEAR